MHKHCQLICCPNCGYQVVDENKSRLARFLRWMWPVRRRNGRRAPRTRSGATQRLVCLADVHLGVAVEVDQFDRMPPGRLARLSAFGLVPGSQVRLLQRRPAPVIRIGETDLALSAEIISQIWVRPMQATIPT